MTSAGLRTVSLQLVYNISDKGNSSWRSVKYLSFTGATWSWPIIKVDSQFYMLWKLHSFASSETSQYLGRKLPPRDLFFLTPIPSSETYVITGILNKPDLYNLSLSHLATAACDPEGMVPTHPGCFWHELQAFVLYYNSSAGFEECGKSPMKHYYTIESYWEIHTHAIMCPC